MKTEVVVIGAGPAGYVCAIRLAQLGKKVVVIEKEKPGGVCLNVGCIPSKALIYAGTLYEKISHAGDMGITVKGASLDMKKLMTWKSGVVKKLTDGVAGLLKANGCTLMMGDAKFISPTAIEVKTSKNGKGGERIDFDQCVIAAGSRPSTVNGIKIDHENVIDSTDALELSKVPESLLCIGGGYIGLELGTFYAKAGSKVTVVEAGPRLLGMVDPDLVRVVEKGLKARGVEIKTGTAVKSVKATKSGVQVEFSGESKAKTFSKVLVTVGRTPNTDGLDLEKAGLRVDDRGFLLVNARRQTDIPTIYAIGDVAGQPLLAHKGSKEGIIAAEAIAGLSTVYDVAAMPAVIFTDPEIATVGWTDAEAKAKGFETMTGSFPFAANGRALSVSEPDGMVKIIGCAKTHRVLGVHIVGAEASNLIAEATLAIEMGATVEDLAMTVHAHPTLPETMMEAAEATLGHAIHIFQRKTHRPSAEASATV